MNYSRRRIVAAAVTVPALGLAGCGGSNSPSSSSNADGNSGSDGGSSDGDGDTNTTSTDTGEVYASPLARDTARVFDEVTWFANNYNTTIYQYRGHVTDIKELVTDVRSKSEITESDIEEISSRASPFYDFVQTEMAPHFNETQDIVGTTEHYISQADKFRRREDEAELDAQLASFQRYYNGLGLDSFVTDRFSSRPIRRPLYDYLRSPDLGNVNPVFVVGHPGRPFLRHCKLPSSWSFDLRAEDDLKTAELRTYFSVLDLLFDGVDVSIGRTGRIYVESYTQDGPRRSRPIYLQRYEDATAAEEALSTLSDRTTGEGTTDEFGRPTWHRVFYRRNLRIKFLDDGYAVYDVDENTVYGPDGTVVPETSRDHVFDRARIQREEEPGRNVYVYAARVGRHLVAASPSTLAWEERPTDAENAIKNTWLWGSTDGSS